MHGEPFTKQGGGSSGVGFGVGVGVGSATQHTPSGWKKGSQPSLIGQVQLSRAIPLAQLAGSVWGQGVGVGEAGGVAPGQVDEFGSSIDWL